MRTLSLALVAATVMVAPVWAAADITFAEFQSHVADVAARSDINHDGTLDASEQDTARNLFASEGTDFDRATAAHEEKCKAQSAATWKSMGNNSAPPAPRPVLVSRYIQNAPLGFRMVDTNGDNVMSTAEQQAFLATLAKTCTGEALSSGQNTPADMQQMILRAKEMMRSMPAQGAQ